MADGTVTIETKLDNSGVEKGLNDLKKEVKSSSKSTAQEIDKASDQAQKSVEEVAKSAEKTGKQVEKSAKDSASKAGPNKELIQQQKEQNPHLRRCSSLIKR